MTVREPLVRSADAEREAHEIIALLFGVIDEGGRHFESLAAEAGLNSMQARTLLYLAAPTPMRNVADHLRCDPSYVTEVADELQRRGFLKREAAAKDRRVKLLVLTPDGETMRANLRTQFATTSPVMVKLSPRERVDLKRLLAKMKSEQLD